MGLIAWIIFGALAGWTANMITGANKHPGCLLNIFSGIAGAFIGGLIMEFVSGSDFSFRFNLSSFVVAVVGAIILLTITRRFRGKRN